LEKVSDAVPNYAMTTVLGDFRAEDGKESYLCPACGGHNLHNYTNYSRKQMVSFPVGRDLAVMGTWHRTRIFVRSPDDRLTRKYVTR
jgi:hypothetical protein